MIKYRESTESSNSNDNNSNNNGSLVDSQNVISPSAKSKVLLGTGKKD